jgi:hypothetical protein
MRKTGVIYFVLFLFRWRGNGTIREPVDSKETGNIIGRQSSGQWKHFAVAHNAECLFTVIFVWFVSEESVKIVRFKIKT